MIIAQKPRIKNSVLGFSTTHNKKIIIFFAIAVIILGLIIGFIALNSFIKKSNKNKNLLNKPEILISQEGNQIKVVANYENGIKSVTYTWNDTDIKQENYDSVESTEKLLNLPEGEENKLYIKVVGSDGTVSEKTEIEKVETGNEPTTDTEKPQIDWYQENHMLKAKITDNIAIDYVKYNWEGEEVKEVKAEEDGQTYLEINIEVARRTVKLYMTAYDKAGNEAEKNETVVGVYEPTIKMSRLDNVITVVIEHDMGIKKAIITIDDKQYSYDESLSIYNPNETKLILNFKIDEGLHYVKVEAYSFEETEKTVEAKCEYQI